MHILGQRTICVSGQFNVKIIQFESLIALKNIHNIIFSISPVNDLECKFWDNKILETQEHLEECMGLSWERRNLKMDTEGGKIIFFKRVEKKLG